MAHRPSFPVPMCSLPSTRCFNGVFTCLPLQCSDASAQRGDKKKLGQGDANTSCLSGNSDHNKDHHHQSASDPQLSPPPPYERTTNVSSIRGGLDKSLGEAAARSPAESRGREAGKTQEPRGFNPHITLDATSFAPGYYYYGGRWMQDISRPSCNIPCFQSHDGALICGVCTVVFLVLCAIIGFLMFLLSRCGVAPGA